MLEKVEDGTTNHSCTNQVGVVVGVLPAHKIFELLTVVVVVMVKLATRIVRTTKYWNKSRHNLPSGHLGKGLIDWNVQLH